MTMSRPVEFGMILFMTLMKVVSSEYIEFDMGRKACDQIEPNYMTAQDRYDVFAQPRPGAIIGRTSCNIMFQTLEAERFTIEIKKIIFGDCGPSIKIYDGDVYLRRERWNLDCNTKSGGVFTTGSNYLVIRLEAESSQAYNFRLSVVVAQGNAVSGGNTDMSSSSLSAGALAGIGVGIAIVVGLFAAVIIWCCIRYMRQSEDKRAQSMQSVYTTSSSQSHHISNAKPVDVFIGVENKRPNKVQNGKGNINYAYRHSSQSSDENDGPVNRDPRGTEKRAAERQHSSRNRDNGNDRQYENTKRHHSAHVGFDDKLQIEKNNKSSSNGIIKQKSQKQYSSSEKQDNKKTPNGDSKNYESGGSVRDKAKSKKIQCQDNPVFEHESDLSNYKERSRSPTRTTTTTTTESHTRSYSPSQDTSKQSDSMDSAENGVGCHFRRNSQRSSTRSRSSSRARSNRRRHNGSLTRSHNSNHRSHSHGSHGGHGSHRHRSSSRSRTRSRSRSPGVKYHDRQSYVDDYYTSRTTNI